MAAALSVGVLAAAAMVASAAQMVVVAGEAVLTPVARLAPEMEAPVGVRAAPPHLVEAAAPRDKMEAANVGKGIEAPLQWVCRRGRLRQTARRGAVGGMCQPAARGRGPKERLRARCYSYYSHHLLRVPRRNRRLRLRCSGHGDVPRTRPIRPPTPVALAPAHCNRERPRYAPSSHGRHSSSRCDPAHQAAHRRAPMDSRMRCTVTWTRRIRRTMRVHMS